MTKIKIVVTHYTQGFTTIFDYISVKDGIITHIDISENSVQIASLFVFSSATS